jgi:hypothetical protein
MFNFFRNNSFNPTKNLWQRRIKDWQKSGLSQMAFCKKNNISFQQLSKWKHKLQDNRYTNQKFVEIHTKNQSMIYREDIELIISEKYRILIKSSFNPELLKKIILTLRDIL